MSDKSSATQHIPDPPQSTAGTVFDPQIIAYCCTYCAYTAADLAGSMRLQYSPYIRIVKLPCTGKMDPLFVLTAFEKGADGVFVAGCLEGSCHFVSGNLRARKRIEYTKGLLLEAGVNPDRLEMYNLSSSMGRRFGEICDEMTEKVRRLGPMKIHEVPLTQTEE